MNKSSLFKIFTCSIIGLTVLSGCSKKSTNSNDPRLKEVVIYTYDSFISEWGAGREIGEKFEASSDYTVTWVDCGDGVQVLSRALLEKDNVQADIILGLDNNIADKANAAGILDPYKPENADKLIPEDVIEVLGKKWTLTPFDYSHFAMIYDTQSNVPCEGPSVRRHLRPEQPDLRRARNRHGQRHLGPARLRAAAGGPRLRRPEHGRVR